MAALWNISMDIADWQRIEKVRKASTVDWHKAAHTAYPNLGYASLPALRDDCWNCDVEGLADWKGPGCVFLPGKTLTIPRKSSG